MIKLLIDENFNHRILRALKLRQPKIDYLVVQQTEMQGAKDPELLAWAAEQGRILVTHDLKTIPKYAYHRVESGLPMTGVIALAKDLPIGQAIEELLLVINYMEPGDCANRVINLPL